MLGNLSKLIRQAPLLPLIGGLLITPGCKKKNQEEDYNRDRSAIKSLHEARGMTGKALDNIGVDWQDPNFKPFSTNLNEGVGKTVKTSGLINGEMVDIGFDTGAPNTTIGTKLFESLKAKGDLTPNPKQPGSYLLNVTINGIQNTISAQLANDGLSVIPLNIGMDWLYGKTLKLDLGSKTFTVLNNFKLQDELSKFSTKLAVPLYLEGYRPYITAIINGKPSKILLDTGGPAMLILFKDYANFVKSLPINTNAMKLAVHMPADQTVIRDQARLATIEINLGNRPTKLECNTVVNLNQSIQTMGGLDGVLGALSIGYSMPQPTTVVICLDPRQSYMGILSSPINQNTKK